MYSFHFTVCPRVHQAPEFSVELEILDKALAAISNGETDEYMWMRLTDANIFSPFLTQFTAEEKEVVVKYEIKTGSTSER